MVTENEQEVSRPNWLVAVHETLVVPKGNLPGDGGEHDVETVTPGTSEPMAEYVMMAEGSLPIVLAN
jgi:hypothetical protein